MRTDPWQMWGLVSPGRFSMGYFIAPGPGHGQSGDFILTMIANEVATQARCGVLGVVLVNAASTHRSDGRVAFWPITCCVSFSIMTQAHHTSWKNFGQLPPL